MQRTQKPNVKNQLVKSITFQCAAALTIIMVTGSLGTSGAFAEMSPSMGAKINAANETSIPKDFRKWVFIGAPLTPHGLNGGKAGFPEFHHVYIEPGAFAEYKKTGKFPEGTTIVKELALLHKGDYKDGSRDEASGRGFFAKSFSGIDMMVKDTKRFKETNGWGFFNFGHHAPPYAKKAAAAPNEACAFCHTANATKDMVFSKFYPILNSQ